MNRSNQALAAVLVAVLVVATCAVLLASASHAQADPCGRTHVWTPAKPAAGTDLAALDAAAVPAGFARLLHQVDVFWSIAAERRDPCVRHAPADPLVPRAPPLG
jgi:hypothetical protein